MSKVLTLPFFILLVTSCGTTRVPATATGAPSGAQTDPAGDGLFPGVGTPSALRSDVPFESLEGPFWVASSVPASATAAAATNGYLLFSDVIEANAPGARIYRFDPGASPGAGRFSVLPYPASPSFPATSTNGLAIDRTGSLLACERYNSRVIRLGTGGRLSVLADHFPAATEGVGSPKALPLNAPNDLAVRRDGNVYFTDSDWGVRPGAAHGPMGVYRVSPHGNLDRVIELEKPNGIALSPDEATLYVGSDVQAKVWRIPLDAAGIPGAPSLMIDGAKVPGGFKVPDGICVDDAGNLYVTNNDDVIKAIVVFDHDGRPLGRIPFPARPSNCSFGGQDRRTMYVTTLHAVYEVRMPTPGLP